MMVRYLVVSVFGFQGCLQVDRIMVKCPLIGGLLVSKTGLFLDSSMVEHAAVNRGVVGSSPTRGGDECFFGIYHN